jgi:hypothetical protein
MPDTPPITGETLREAIAEACSLNNPRLSEVEWDDVAAVLRRAGWVERDPEPGEPVGPRYYRARLAEEPHDA